MLHLIECMERCRVDFGRTGRTRTLILVYFWNGKCCCLVSVYLFWCTFEFGCVIARLRLSQLHTRVLHIYATTLQWRRLTTPDWYWFRWNIRHIVMLTLDDQRVRLFVFVHIRIWISCCLVTMMHHNCTIFMQPHSNRDGSRLWIDVDFGGIYDTLLCWFLTTSAYVYLFWCTFEFACVVACLA